MLRTRWRKVFLDLRSNKARTILVIAAITVGVFAVGLVAVAQHILLSELTRDYLSSNPASATIYTMPLDDEFIKSVENMPEVAQAEGRATLRVRVNVGANQWRDLVLTAVPDYNTITLDKIIPVAGAAEPGKGELLVEDYSIDFLNTALGETLLIELDDGTQKEMLVSGTTHDSHVPNADILNRGFGFITPETLETLGGSLLATELRYTVAAHPNDIAHIRAVGQAIEDKIEKSGREVYFTSVPTPGEHWAQDIIETLVLLFTVFGVLILFLSGFLVVNTISALLAQQVNQIGVMKLVGGKSRQIMGMYFLTVAIYGLVALLIGMPAATLFAQFLIRDYVAGLLNFHVVDVSVPWTIITLQVGVALLIPLLAAAWPVLRGTTITTHAALNHNGMGQGYNNKGLMERFFNAVQENLPVQRPLIISLRNTVRRKGRLALTLITLILGTALFISVLSVRDSVQSTLDNFLRFHEYDVRVTLSRPYRTSQLELLAQEVEGVVAVETWASNSVRRVRPDGSDSESISLQAAPADSAMMNPLLENGRWLTPEDEYAIVVNTDVIDEEPDLRVGDEIVLDINGRENAWTIVGITRSTAGGPVVYVDSSDYSYITRSTDQANSVRVITQQHDNATQEEMASRLADHYTSAGLRVDTNRTTNAIRDQADFQFNIVIGFLVLMAVLLAIVGGLGLTTTMSINVLERIREIGVLRAIGASDGSVRLIVLAEGIVIGWLSFVAGGILSIPFSRILSQQVGKALLGSPLDYTFSINGLIIWFIIVTVLATIASLGPARNASRLTIREVLAYE
ncbi:MAG: ABC transporter permease [Anaerolineae bacterium]|nr:ABC transporter permease [Anaerolineae bacterium]